MLLLFGEPPHVIAHRCDDVAVQVASRFRNRLPPATDIDDVLQFARIELWKIALSFRGGDESTFRGWATKKLRQRVNRHMLAHRRRGLTKTGDRAAYDSGQRLPQITVHSSPDRSEDEPPNALDVAEAEVPSAFVRWSESRWEEVLGLVTFEQRQVIIAVYIDGLSHEQAAVRIGITADRVNRLAVKAREKLRAKLPEIAWLGELLEQFTTEEE